MKSNPLLDVINGKVPSRIPCWFMRQAGRYLPEYLELRSKHSMLEVIQTAELATEITLQPLRRYDLDASIIFADILNPLIAMGIELDFVKGSGPKIFNPIKSKACVDKLIIPDPHKAVPATLEAISSLKKHELLENKALFGFCGAPFTLSAYMLEGGGSSKLHVTKKWIYQEEKAFHNLQEKLVEYLSQYLVSQAEAGADILQVFDSWLGFLGPSDYKQYVEPYLFKLFEKVKSQTNVPLVFFATGVSSLFPKFTNLNIDVLGVDWRLSVEEARELTQDKFILQGNLDPLHLFAGEEKLNSELDIILNQNIDHSKYIFNLGHGIIPKTPIDSITQVLDKVHSITPTKGVNEIPMEEAC